jgi:dihydrofolate synthase/folylpolyglutamate synthase
MEYEDLVQDIFRRFPSVQKEGFKPGAYKPGLEGVRDFDKVLGSPSGAIKTIHVAGTNGKGSVANMLAAALSAAGYRTGLYTSPHLVDFRERCRIDGEMIPKEYVHEFLEKWKPYFEAENLSFFEITTGLAFRWFADSKVDVAVIECGLGGRLDSTNIITPELSVITSIGLDHCALLGSTLAEIAAEKAGIMKPGVPCVVGDTHPETAPVFDAAAKGPLVYADKAKPRLWERHKGILEAMDLQAPVQRKNLRTVLCALELLQQEFPGDQDKFIYGIEHTAALMHFHGRWERLREKPLVIADIGHNAHALASNFKALKAAKRPLIIVYGIMADKDLDSIIPLMPRKAKYIFVAPDTPRALPAEEIKRRAKGLRNTITAPSVKAGIKMAMNEATDDTIIYIGGSTFVVAEAL